MHFYGIFSLSFPGSGGGTFPFPPPRYATELFEGILLSFVIKKTYVLSVETQLLRTKKLFYRSLNKGPDVRQSNEQSQQLFHVMFTECQHNKKHLKIYFLAQAEKKFTKMLKKN